MSQVYTTEPHTSGRVLLETTHGPLEIHLWCRECPSTTKYFLQLCMDGFFENVIFHRIVPNFLVQTGALRYDATKNALTSLSDENQNAVHLYRKAIRAEEVVQRQPYEVNSRIRFNHRGQVAMALGIQDEIDNNEVGVLQPQFFVTLDDASELDGKHVCFGTVSGPTIFNALRIGGIDVDPNTHQPTILEEAPRINRVKIVDNPYSDLSPSLMIPWNISKEEGPTKKKKKLKGVRNINVLSFGDEMEMEAGGGRIKSSHDMLHSKQLSSEVDGALEVSVIGATTSTSALTEGSKSDDRAKSSDTPKVGKGIKESRHSNSSRVNDSAAALLSSVPSEKTPVETSAIHRSSNSDTQDREKMQTNTEPKRKSLVAARRAKYAAQRGQAKYKRQAATMTKLREFQNKMSKKKDAGLKATAGGDHDADLQLPDYSKNQESLLLQKRIAQNKEGYHGEIIQSSDSEGDSWMMTKFNCRKHQDLNARLGGDGRDAIDDYKVVDEAERLENYTKGRKHSRHKF